MAGKLRVLLVEDEPSVRFGVRDFLETHGFDIEEAGERDAARAAFLARRPDAVLLDYLLADGDTGDLLREMKDTDESVPILILTAHGSIDLAVRSIKEGADQFLTKPVDLTSLLVVLRREIDSRRDRRKGVAEGRRDARSGSPDPFLGTSAIIRALKAEVLRVLDSDASVLIRGETGSGKGVLARWMHDHGPRAAEPFVDLNCAGLSRELLESELFGHEKGAFTGALAAKPGLLEVADRGSLFLDEIGDLDLTIQPRLLKALEEKRFRRVGEVKDRRVDVRLIAATNQDLPELVREKKFRGDLYYRINTIQLVLPPLRERREDVPGLARRILDHLARELGRGRVDLTPEAEARMLRYDWPGNVRELRNVLERALLLTGGSTLGPDELRFEAGAVGPARDANAAAAPDDANLNLEDVERRHIERVLLEEGWHVERAAAKLGLARSSLYQKIKRFALTPPQ